MSVLIQQSRNANPPSHSPHQHQVQTKQERTRLTELNHLIRLILLVAFLWLNNGTRHCLTMRATLPQLILCVRVRWCVRWYSVLHLLQSLRGDHLGPAVRLARNPGRVQPAHRHRVRDGRRAQFPLLHRVPRGESVHGRVHLPHHVHHQGSLHNQAIMQSLVCSQETRVCGAVRCVSCGDRVRWCCGSGCCAGCATRARSWPTRDWSSPCRARRPPFHLLATPRTTFSRPAAVPR